MGYFCAVAIIFWRRKPLLDVNSNDLAFCLLAQVVAAQNDGSSMWKVREIGP